ncbi:MAG: lysophospholipase [Bacteroidota bacterium]|nr:lysophospholipase [Bacteroidota bacterium]
MEELKKKNRLVSFVKLILLVLLVQFILINISAALHANKLIHLYDVPEFKKQTTASRNIFTTTWKLFAGPRYYRAKISEKPYFIYDTVQFKTASQITIDAWYSKTYSAKGTVILFHGITGNKQQLFGEAYAFKTFGYNVMLVDLRSHGNSGGKKTSIGVKESEEVKLAYDYCIQHGDKNIFLYGLSMGAVVVSKAIYDYDLSLSGIIIEMPFASLQDHLKARARVLGFPEQPFAFLVTFWLGIEQGFNGFNHKTTRYVKKIKCPVLMQWGQLDKYVLEKETISIFENIASQQKKLVNYENAGHSSLLQNDPDKWKNEVEKFLSQHK